MCQSEGLVTFISVRRECVLWIFRNSAFVSLSGGRRWIGGLADAGHTSIAERVAPVCVYAKEYITTVTPFGIQREVWGRWKTRYAMQVYLRRQSLRR